MLSVARQRTSDIENADARLKLHESAADRLPLPDRPIDLVALSFVFQFVPDRLAALREYAVSCRNADAFAWFDLAGRLALQERIKRRLELVSPADFCGRAPIVYAVGRRLTESAGSLIGTQRPVSLGYPRRAERRYLRTRPADEESAR